MTNKRLILTLSPGRSGTAYLTQLLKGLPDIRAEHEPAPSFQSILPQARKRPGMALRFLREKKLPAIEEIAESTYIETSHYAGKGFIEPLLELGVVPDVIVLRRIPRKIAVSWFLMGASMEALVNERLETHLLHPGEPSFLRPAGKTWERWNDYQLCYWYALESQFRGQHYAELIRARGGKVFETFLQPLVQGNKYRALLAWLKVPPAIAAQRVNDTDLRQRKVNEKKPQKRQRGRQDELAALDLDALEAQVRKHCRVQLPEKE